MKRLLPPLVVLLLANGASARLPGPNDAPYSFLKRDIVISVKKDGTHELEYEEIIQVLKEGRKQEVGTRRIPYNSRASSLKVLRAAVENGDAVREVDSAYIEDKPLYSPEEGFDQRNQLTIAYPDVRQGSKLHLKYRMKTTETPFPGHYSERFMFGSGFLQQQGNVTLRSEAPLFFELNDPTSSLQVKQAMDGKIQETKIVLTKPLYFDSVNELKPSLEMNDFTWAVVSMHESYADLAKPILSTYEKRLSAPLPPGLKAIAEQAKAKGETIGLLNAVTSLLAEQVRYTGDWRPIHGGFVPRELTTIDQTRFGDCKDFSASTARILRELGFESYVAFVERDRSPSPLPKLPLQGAFNHAIVWAKKDGREYFIDPTNLQSFAQGAFEDIAEREALVLSPTHPRLAMIPSGGVAGSSYVEGRSVNLAGTGTSSIDARLSFNGRSAVDLTGASLRVSPETLSYRFATWFSKESDLKSYAADFDLNSRVVKDFSVSLKIQEQRSSNRTTAGYLYPLQSFVEAGDLLSLESKDRVSGYFMGMPRLLKRETTLKRAAIVGNLPGSCSVESPWFRVQRKFGIKPSGVEISDQMEIKVHRIDGAEIRSRRFLDAQAALKKCYDVTALVYRASAERAD